MSLRDIVAIIRRRRREPPPSAPAPGFSPERPKQREGYGCAPEGSYTVDARNPRSAFHLALRSWSAIRRRTERQAGCVAITDAEICEVWPLAGARVVIHP